MITKFPFILDDINNSSTIFVPNFPSLKVEMARRKTKPVVSNCVNTLKDILQLHKKVLVAADIMFVNRMAFLVSISIHVKLNTVQYIGKRTNGDISKSLEILMMFTIDTLCM